MSLFRKHDVVRHNLRTNQTFQIHLTSDHIFTKTNKKDLDIRRYVSYVLDKPILTKRHPSASPTQRLKEKQPASYTLEAAIILPIFISLMAGIMMFFWIIIIQFGTEYSINFVVRQCAVTGKENSVATLAAACDAAILKNKVPINYVYGKYLGLDYSDSDLDHDSIDLTLKYSIRIPFLLLGTHMISVEQHAFSRRWTGYDPDEDDGDSELVYVTERGVAYHKSLSCPYLDLSIRAVPKSSVASLRNKSEGRYYACENCYDGNSENVYITDYGDRYHSSLSCTGLKRSIKAIPLEEAASYHACVKCAS